MKDAGLLVLDHVNRVEKMSMFPHPMTQIQIDHPIYPGTGTLEYLLNSAGLRAARKYQDIPGTTCYFINKSDNQEPFHIDCDYIDKIDKLSRKIKSIPKKKAIKNLIKRTLLGRP